METVRRYVSEEESINSSLKVDEPYSIQCCPNPSTSKSETPNVNKPKFELYKGIKLRLKNVREKFPFFVAVGKESCGGQLRQKIQCLICAEHKEEAQKHTRNNIVPMATGVFVYGRDKLMQLVDHTESDSHTAACKAKELQNRWEEKSSKHPWVNSNLRHKDEVFEILIRMCLDVYNDCISERNSSYSWPSRSLTHLAANSFLGHVQAHGIDADFVEYEPSPSDLHYRDPVFYGQMVSCIGKVEQKKLRDTISECVAFTIQVDGSLSKQMRDNKFISCRVLTPRNELQSLFLYVGSPESNGAKGIFEVVQIALENCSAPMDKFVGVTTDGEAANTGSKAGLWKLLQEFAGKKLMTYWCVAHRSDLAVEQIVDTVPELKIWKSDLIALATYFRTSKNKTKLLNGTFPKARKFPKHHDVRFAEHMLNVVDVALHNIDGCIKTWEKVTNSTISEEGEKFPKRERDEAFGYIRNWNKKQVSI